MRAETEAPSLRVIIGRSNNTDFPESTSPAGKLEKLEGKQLLVEPAGRKSLSVPETTLPGKRRQQKKKKSRSGWKEEEQTVPPPSSTKVFFSSLVLLGVVVAFLPSFLS